MVDKDLIGKDVVSMSDGARVGTVKDLLFQGLALNALVVRGEHGEGILPFPSLSANGADAITIESYKLVDWNAGKHLDPETRSSHDLRKLAVVDDKGTALGHVHDFTMDSKGHVEHISVRTEGVFGVGAKETIVPGKRVRAIGENMITVESAPKPK